SFFIANFVYKDMGPFADKKNTKPALVKIFQTFVHKDTKNTLYEAGKLTIMLLFIIANALILKHVLPEERIPQMITESMLSAGLGPITF
ncbi:hypothetical protein OFO99_32795, partial [Escherichia coli]|nr:hypothetical protein [Escherichia coli]